GSALLRGSGSARLRLFALVWQSRSMRVHQLAADAQVAEARGGRRHASGAGNPGGSPQATAAKVVRLGRDGVIGFARSRVGDKWGNGAQAARKALCNPRSRRRAGSQEISTPAGDLGANLRETRGPNLPTGQV